MSESSKIEVRVIPHYAMHQFGYDYVDGWLLRGTEATAVTTVKALPHRTPVDREIQLMRAEIECLRQMLIKLAGGEMRL